MFRNFSFLAQSRQYLPNFPVFKFVLNSFKIRQYYSNKPQAAPLRFAPRRRGGGLEGICRAEVDSRTAASPRGETIAVQQ